MDSEKQGQGRIVQMCLGWTRFIQEKTRLPINVRFFKWKKIVDSLSYRVLPRRIRLPVHLIQTGYVTINPEPQFEPFSVGGVGGSSFINYIFLW